MHDSDAIDTLGLEQQINRVIIAIKAINFLHD